MHVLWTFSRISAGLRVIERMLSGRPCRALPRHALESPPRDTRRPSDRDRWHLKLGFGRGEDEPRRLPPAP